MSESAPVADERLVFRPERGPKRDVLVTLLLRGGMDGVHAFPPLADPDYAGQRGDFDASDPNHRAATPLDDFFGLHRAAQPLLETYRNGHLAVIHACGPSQPLLSHFDAMRHLERGSNPTGPKDGWLGRHLAMETPAAASPLRALSIGSSVPLVLRGVAGARALTSLDGLRLELPLEWQPGFMTALARLYSGGANPLAAAGRGTLATLTTVDRLTTDVNPAAGERYGVYTPKLLSQLDLVSRLIKAEVGLEAAVLSQGGWDTHQEQIRQIEQPLHTLAWSLRIFLEDLGDFVDRVTVVVISEFGRRIAPNGGGGTDHGRASAALVLGGNIHGGKCYARWPGMGPAALDRDGNLLVTTDFRDVLAEIVDRRLGNPRPDHVFPDYAPNYLGFAAE